MTGMHDGHDMPGMDAVPPPSMSTNGTGMMHHHNMMMMHMTFFWGKNAEILFSGWPGTSLGMYVLALVFVFVLAFLAEWLSHRTNRVGSGLVQTLMHGIRIGLAYMVMLAVMSFNVGVFLVAVAGHSLGFLVFGSRVFNKSPEKDAGLSPTGC